MRSVEGIAWLRENPFVRGAAAFTFGVSLLVGAAGIEADIHSDQADDQSALTALPNHTATTTLPPPEQYVQTYAGGSEVLDCDVEPEKHVIEAGDTIYDLVKQSNEGSNDRLFARSFLATLAINAERGVTEPEALHPGDEVTLLGDCELRVWIATNLEADYYQHPPVEIDRTIPDGENWGCQPMKLCKTIVITDGSHEITARH